MTAIPWYRISGGRRLRRYWQAKQRAWHDRAIKISDSANGILGVCKRGSVKSPFPSPARHDPQPPVSTALMNRPAPITAKASTRARRKPFAAKRALSPSPPYLCQAWGCCTLVRPGGRHPRQRCRSTRHTRNRQGAEDARSRAHRNGTLVRGAGASRVIIVASGLLPPTTRRLLEEQLDLACQLLSAISEPPERLRLTTDATTIDWGGGIKDTHLLSAKCEAPLTQPPEFPE